MNKKKLLIIVLVFFVLSGTGLAVYNLFLKSDEGPAPRGNGGANPIIKPIGQEKIMSPVIVESVLSVKYYLLSNGHVKESDFEGADIKTISDTNLPRLKSVLWSPDAKKVINFFESPPTANKNLYDFQTKQSSLLNENIQAIAWSPDSQKIAYHFKTVDNAINTIALAEPDGSQWKNIFQTRLENILIEWPVPDKISLRSRPKADFLGFLFVLDPQTAKLEKVLSDIYGFSAKWSDDGQKILYQKTNQKGRGLKLFVSDALGQQEKELPVATLIEKCTWLDGSQRLLCAVPQKISENAVMPDDYFLGRISITDDFYLINLADNKKTKIAWSDDRQSFDALNLMVAPQKDYFLFLNQKDGLLYSARIDL